MTSGQSSKASHVLVAILAGGQSRRMGGRDKATIPVDDIPMLERVAIAATQAGLSVAIIGRQTDQLHFQSGTPIHAMPDSTPGMGPLGGLQTAISLVPENGWILLCPCDVPNIRCNDFEWLVAQVPQAEADGFDGIVPVWQGQHEPLFAMYNARLCPLIEAQIDRNDYALKHLIASANFQFVELPDNLREAITDIDTEEQLRHLNKQ